MCIFSLFLFLQTNPNTHNLTSSSGLCAARSAYGGGSEVSEERCEWFSSLQPRDMGENEQSEEEGKSVHVVGRAAG